MKLHLSVHIQMGLFYHYSYKHRYVATNITYLFTFTKNKATIIAHLFTAIYLCINQISMLKQDRTIIHVEVKDTHEHFYFGSAAAMYEDSRIKNLLQISYQTFRKRRVSTEKPYENDLIIVRKGALNTILHG